MGKDFHVQVLVIVSNEVKRIFHFIEHRCMNVPKVVIIIYRAPTILWGKETIWQPISSDERVENIPLKYYRIDNDTLIIDEPFTDRIKFWENILSQTSARYEDEL